MALDFMFVCQWQNRMFSYSIGLFVFYYPISVLLHFKRIINVLYLQCYAYIMEPYSKFYVSILLKGSSCVMRSKNRF